MYNVMRPWCQKMEAKLSFSDTTLSPPSSLSPCVGVCDGSLSVVFSPLHSISTQFKKTRLTAHVNVLL